MKTVTLFLLVMCLTQLSCSTVRNSEKPGSDGELSELNHEELTFYVSNHMRKFAFKEDLRIWAIKQIEAAEAASKVINDPWGARLTIFLHIPGPPAGQFVIKDGGKNSSYVKFLWGGPNGFFGVVVGDKSLNYSEPNVFAIKCSPGIYAWHGIFSK